MEPAMKPALLTLALALTLSACVPANRGYGNNGAGNRGWDRFRHTVEHPIPGTDQVAEIR
jgi:hypothetical protein